MRPAQGARVFVGDKTGTVRYVGKVAGKGEAEYVGVEWDDVARGTHNGAVAGVVYFACRPGGTGSLLREGAVALEAGRNASEVVWERYVDRTNQESEEDLYVLTGRQARVAIELVGMADQQTSLEQLRSASAASSCVTNLDSMLFEMCPLLEELDVSSNALASLPEVVAVLAPSVTSLNVSLNPLFESPKSSLKSRAHLQSLAVAASQVSWAILLPCLLPSLKVLDVSDNPQLGCLPALLAGKCPELTHLHANGCGITDWSAIGDCLVRLPKLQRLFLSHNPIHSIPPLPECVLQELEVLAVTGTQLDGFAWAESLAKLPQLRHVRFADTPCHRLPRSRLALLGLLPHLTQLNGAEVPERERLDAEILRQKKNEHEPGKQAAPLERAHLSLTVQFTSATGAVSPVIPVSSETTVSMLRDLAFRHTQIAPFRQRLWARSRGDVQRTLLDQNATLDWYGFPSGAVDVLVEETE